MLTLYWNSLKCKKEKSNRVKLGEKGSRVWLGRKNKRSIATNQIIFSVLILFWLDFYFQQLEQTLDTL